MTCRKPRNRRSVYAASNNEYVEELGPLKLFKNLGSTYGINRLFKLGAGALRCRGITHNFLLLPHITDIREDGT